jgi:hypothetical protein
MKKLLPKSKKHPRVLAGDEFCRRSNYQNHDLEKNFTNPLYKKRTIR